MKRENTAAPAVLLYGENSATDNFSIWPYCRRSRQLPFTSYSDELNSPLDPHDPTTWDHVAISRTKGSWVALRLRMTDEKHPQYHQYGGRLDIDPRWLVSFAQFAADVGPRPAGHTLDRIDNDRGYWSDNCRWATPAAQNTNRTLRGKS